MDTYVIRKCCKGYSDSKQKQNLINFFQRFSSTALKTVNISSNSIMYDWDGEDWINYNTPLL